MTDQDISIDRSQTGDQIVAGACFETDLKRCGCRASGRTLGAGHDVVAGRDVVKGGGR